MNASQQHRSSVLIVDNDEHILTSLEALVKNEGFDSRTTWSGHEALALIESHPFDVVLVNNHLPDLYYGDFLKRASKQVPHAYIVVMQKGKPLPGAMRRHKSLGAVAIVDKKDTEQIRQVLITRHLAAGSRLLQ
jgi:DNA-binding NtrC family response regulator